MTIKTNNPQPQAVEKKNKNITREPPSHLETKTKADKKPKTSK